MDLINHNRLAWNQYVAKKDRWTIPVSSQTIEEAKNGNWGIVLTATKSVPHSWFPDLKGLDVLGLASGGGQQMPILASLGANIVSFDNSENQLKQDDETCESNGLPIKTIQGDMRDLSVFESEQFDLIFNPCSILFVDDPGKVWRECHRVLKKGGILMSGLMQPISFQLSGLNIKYKQPFSDIASLAKEELDELIHRKEALLYGHSLTKLISDALTTGFLMTDFYEDDWGGEQRVDAYFPSYFAFRMIKKDTSSDR